MEMAGREDAGMDDDELSAREREFTDQLGRLRFRLASGQTESLDAVRELRRGIAKVKTHSARAPTEG